MDIETTNPATVALDRLLSDRFSCRGFLSRPVPDDVIAAICDMARKAPSWCNTQPWELIVTRPGTTEPFAQALIAQENAAQEVDSDLAFPTAYTGAFLDRRRATGFALYEAVGVERKDMDGRRRQSLENFRFFGAPHVAILTTEADLGPYGAVDCGGFLACFLMAATSLGVATIAQAAIARHSGFVRDYFALPTSRQVVCGISFGYADPDHPANSFRTTRRAGSELYRFA